MSINFISEPIPELTTTSGQLAATGFTNNASIRLVLWDNTLSVTIVIHAAEWKALCEA